MFDRELHTILSPLLDTADTLEISPSHRADACNLICAIIEKCQTSDIPYARDAVLDDFVWSRLFRIYLERSDEAKTKSVRQVLLVLTGMLLKSDNSRSLELQHKAIEVFIEIICLRQDRLKVKPALQGLAHFLQKDVVALPQLLNIYRKLLDSESDLIAETSTAQSLLVAFLAWIVHHDTSLSAGHMIKSFLAQLRRSPQSTALANNDTDVPIWIRPVIDCLCRWPDRILEFKTHVFPHCFLPDPCEYFQFLSILNFGRHVAPKGFLPSQLSIVIPGINALDHYEELKILLASIEKGKELGIVNDTGECCGCSFTLFSSAQCWLASPSSWTSSLN
jgi:hypothetical protein